MCEVYSDLQCLSALILDVLASAVSLKVVHAHEDLSFEEVLRLHAFAKTGVSGKLAAEKLELFLMRGYVTEQIRIQQLMWIQQLMIQQPIWSDSETNVVGFGN